MPVFSKMFPSIQFHLMENIEGITLREFLSKTKPNSTELKKIQLQLKNIFNSIWESGFIHGDLHLENIMITHDGTVKIIDFGFTQRVTQYNSTKEPVNSWFRRKWPIVLLLDRIPVGNPNLWVTGNLKNIQMYAEHDRNKLVKMGIIKR